jgi:hypothetical protein
VLDGVALPLAVLTVLTSGDEVTEAQVRLRDGRLDAGWAGPCGTARIQIDTRRAGAVRTQYSTRSAGEN